MRSPLLNDNSEDGESQEKGNDDVEPTSSNPTTAVIGLGGYYDVDKCRAFIANQTKISKIDRFSAQVYRALDVESGMRLRLTNILNMFTKRTAQVAHDFTFKCKLGLQRHRQDRILNQQRKPSKKYQSRAAEIKSKQEYLYSSISNDLFYGTGAQLFRTLLSQSIPPTANCIKRKTPNLKHLNNKFIDQLDDHDKPLCEKLGLSEEDFFLSDLFEPKMLVSQLEKSIRESISKSEAIIEQLNVIKQIFERLANEHRDKVDMVYAAEEGRQAATVTRRSAYNLSMAAIKATSTPVHVTNNNPCNYEIS